MNPLSMIFTATEAGNTRGPLRASRAGGFATVLAAALLALLLVPLGVCLLFAWGYWTFKSREASIVEKMDQYYLTVTSPGREEYLLSEDEAFEVPYMASKLSVEAVPTRIYDARGRLMGEFLAEKGVYVNDASDLPVFLKRALVAGEDGTFYRHKGVNWRAIARAMLVNLRSMSPKQGGSTLTQQLAKMMFTTRKKTYGRKIYELFCARKLEEKFTKDQLLLMYLNFAYFGHGAFGVESASRYYFDKPARELELAEAAMLVGIVASPNKYSPFADQILSKARHRTVLARMAKMGYIPESSIEALSEDFWRGFNRRLSSPENSFWRMSVNEAPYPVEVLRRALLKEFDKERLLTGGLRVSATFDLELQRAAEKALRPGLQELNAGVSSSSMPVEGALAAIDPKDGAVLALVGGRGFSFQNQLIRAYSARPIGSSVKPFIYAAAFESGRFKPEDELEDAPIEYRVGGGRTWTPQNYGGKYHGKVTLAFALWKSLNSIAVKLLEAVGVEEAIRVRADASGADPASIPRNLSLALGTVELSALQLARAYGVFVNGGVSREPYLISTVEDREGKVIRDWSARPEGKAALKPETCATLVEVMRGVLGPEGTARAAALKTGFNLPAAGKTGTTNEYKDAWFAGVTPDLSAAVWLGHDDMRLSLGHGKAGGSTAAPIWMEFVKAAYRDRPARGFAPIEGKK